MGTTNVLHCDH